MERPQRKKAVKFTDMEVWQIGHAMVIAIYTITQRWPAPEQFGLTAQIRRAAVSVTSNIAEGFSRATKSDKRHFYTMSHGSLTELQNQLLVARDVGYLNSADFDKLAEQSVTVHKLLTALIKSLKD